MISNGFDVFFVGLGIVICLQPFFFVAKPSFGRLFLMPLTVFASVALYAAIYPHNTAFLIRNVILYTFSCYFILSFFLLHNVRIYYANMVGINIGYEEFTIPLVSWQWSDDFRFLNIFSVPLWRPWSYVKMLRTTYRRLSASDFANLKPENSGLTSNKSHVAVLGCKFRKLVRQNGENGGCFLFFEPVNGVASEIITFADSDALRIVPQRHNNERYRISYIERAGWPPKLDELQSYVLVRDEYYPENLASAR